MAQDEYPKYLQEQKQEGSKSGLMALGGIAAIGAVGVFAPNVRKAVNRGLLKVVGAGAGLGVSGYGYLAKAGGLTSRIQQMGNFIRSIDHSLEQRNPLDLLMDGSGRSKRRFRESYVNGMNEMNRRAATPLKGIPTQLESQLHHYTNTIKGVTHTVHFQNFQFNAVLNDLKRKMPEHFMDKGLHTILAQLRTEGDHDFFSAPSKDKITGLLDRYGKNNATKAGKQHSIQFTDHAQREDFITKMFDTLSHFKNRSRIDRRVLRQGTKPGETYEGMQVQGITQLNRKLFQDMVESRKSREGFLNKVFGDHMRLKDVLEHKEVTDEHGNKSMRWVNKLLDADSIRGQHSDSRVFNHDMGRKLAAYANADDKWFARMGIKRNDFMDMTVDDRLFINRKTGKMTDGRLLDSSVYKAMTFVQQNFKIPYLNFNPLDLMHFSTYQSIREAPRSYFLRRGTIHPFAGDSVQTTDHPFAHNQDAAAKPLATDYMYSNNKMYDVLSGEMVKDNVYLPSGRFGMIPRMASSMGNLHRVDLSKRNLFQKIFDIGGQEQDHMFERFASTFTKFSNEDWEPNTFRMMFSDKAKDPEFQESTYKNLYSKVSQKTDKLSDRTAEYLSPLAKQAYEDNNVDLTKLNTPDEVMHTLGRIAYGLNNKSTGITRNDTSDQIIQTWRNWKRNDTEFLKNKRVQTGDGPMMIGAWQAVDPNETKLVSKLDDVKRLIHQHAIDQIEFANNGLPISKLITEGIKSGDLVDNAFREVGDLKVLNQMQKYWGDVYLQGPEDKAQALESFFKDVGVTRNKDNDKIGGTPTGFGRQLYSSIDRSSPWYSMGPGQAPPQYQGYVNYTIMNKAKGHRAWLQDYNEQVQQGKDPFDAMLKSTGNVFGQLFAGRKNLGDVTTATMPLYYMFERMDNALSKVGLGLSQNSRGSAASIFLNQFGRRIVLPYAAFKQLQWLDDSTNNTASDAAADGYVKANIGMAKLKDTLGINKLFKSMSELTPGLDQFWETPIGGILKYGSFGFFGDSRSADETQKYYEQGDDPVRHGRWWGLGSNTPWEGGKIDYFQPNWYRRQQSHYKYTDTLYGDQSEYWANNAIPTLTHPLAPLKHFITDPNHYYNKHKEDRPYPTYGGVNEVDMIPMVGPALNKIIYGDHVRPGLEKAHREYLKDINNYYESQYDAATQGGYIEFLPAGGAKTMSSGGGFGGGFGEGMSSYITPEGLGTPGDPNGDLQAALGGGGITDVTSFSKSELTAINLGFTKGMGLSPARSITSLEKMRDPNTIADLADINMPGGFSNVLGQGTYSATELGGIYGFGVNMIKGDVKFRQSLDTARNMTSYSRAWWDLEFGGADGPFGGEFSEIFRRYNPRDQQSRNTYNPFKNTMPDWMPGVNYFTDFQHGDPYTKIQKGEMRLPGKAYETLHKLHPDEFGDYGAFDRFRILADAAPYSDEYKFWRRVVSQMNSSGQLDDNMTEQFATIRDQVSQKKQKYHFYNYKFNNAEVEKKKVRVTQVLDANTFMTDMDPIHPVRLAGVHVPVGAEEAQAWLSQFIHPGAEITIGMDSDPLNRVRDDTLQTIRAVVYADHNDEDTAWTSSIRGQSINSILAKKDFGGKDKITVRNDGTAVSNAALYDKSQITVGKLMEWTMHTGLPGIPALGPIFDKFLQVRSPLETYKRNEVYGKSWKPWTDPWSGWIQPLAQTLMSRNPIVAAAQGYGIGHLFGRASGHAGSGKYIGKWAGAIGAGLLATVRTVDEFAGENLPGGDHYAWIPGRRKKERELNEYFDILKYMKYKGLYEQANKQAMRYEGVDIDKVINDSESRGEKNKKTREYAASVKKWLSITKKLGYVDQDIIDEQIASAQKRINAIGEDKSLMQIGPHAMQAMQYRSEYESTLYGADPYGDMTKIYRALPKKDREFFTQFMTASPKERNEILRVVPENERRFFEAKWGMKVEDKPGLGSYFLNHNLPGESWEGWRPDVSLDSVKLKVAQNEGMDLSEFGYWDDDVQRAQGAQSINPYRPSMSIDPNRIEKILRGAGLSDVSVNLTSTPHHENVVNVTTNFVKDRSQDIVNAINDRMGNLIG